MADGWKKLAWGRWLIRMLMGASLIALLLMYGSDKNVTVSELEKVIASTSIFIVIGVEILDKIVDKSTYYKLYGGFYRATGVQAGTRSSFIVSMVTPAVVSTFIFIVVLYLVAGSITMNLDSYSPAVILWAGAIATYAMLPETGDDELISWVWLGATIATKGQYLHEALAIPAITKITTLLLSKLPIQL